MKKIFYFIFTMLCFIPITVCQANEKVTVQFASCVDGDTAKFVLNHTSIKTRFLAIDTPETKHPTKGEEPWGKEASEFTCNQIKNAHTIELEYDDGSDKTDKYDRHLVWVWVDGKLLQKELIKKGYAKVSYLYGDYSYTKELQQVEQQAKFNKVGIWSDYNPLEDRELINQILTVVSAILVIILCIFFPKYRKKTINKTKRKIKNNIKKELKNKGLS